MSGQESSADINSLQEALSQQQQKITALREMVRKSDGSQGKTSSRSTTEKVKNITKQLTHLKAKARSAFYSGDTSLLNAEMEEFEPKPKSTPPVILQQQLSVPTATQNVISSTGSEKVQLLRQQMEQNKLRLAQRASSKLHLEQLVSELKEKLDSTQQSLDDSSQLGKSMTDLSQSLQLTAPTVPSSIVKREQRHRSATDLTSQPAFSLEKERIKFLENRCRLLEKQLEKERQAITTKQSEIEDEEIKRRQELENRIWELEQNLQEAQKQSIPGGDVKSKEILERRVQELEEKLKEGIQGTRSNEDQERIKELEDRLLALDQQIAEKTRNEKDLSNENERLRAEIVKRRKPSNENDQSDNENIHFELIDLRNENNRMVKRIAELEEINNVLEATRCDLTSSNNLYKDRVEQLENELEKVRIGLTEVQQLSETIETNSNEFSEDTESQIKTEMAKQIQELQDMNQQFHSENDKLKETIAEHEKVEVDDEQIKAKISNLEATIESQREDLTQRQITLTKLEEELMEKTIELNVTNANFRVLEEKLQKLSKSKSKSLFSTALGGDSGTESDTDMQAEVQRLKQKLDESNKAMIKLKLKCKQSEKQIDKLKKGSNLNEELIELQKLNDELQQRITELEDEKGQWQLMQLKENPEKCDVEDLNKTQTETIRLLEEQKYEQSQQLEKLKEELRALKEKTQSEERVVIARVQSEMSEIHLEEQLEEIKQTNENLQQQLDEQNTTIVSLQQQNEDLQLEKQNLDKKLELYLSENMELLDKVEKLSKSSSSAESIEIVDSLTQQERAEMDEFNKRLSCVPQQSSLQRDDPTHHTTTCVNELTQTEMGYDLSDNLTKLREESSELMNKVAMFTSERREVLEKMENLTTENHDLHQRIEKLIEEKNDLENKIIAADELKAKLETELKTVVKQKESLSTQVAETTAQRSQLSGELTSMQKSTEVIAALDNNDGCITLFDKCEKSLSKLDAELEAYRRANDKNSKFNVSKKLAKEAKNVHTQLSQLLEKVKEASTAVETVTVVETVVAVTAPNGKALAEYEQLTAQNRELKTTVEVLRNKVQELEDANLYETSSSLLEIKSTEAVPSDNKKTEEELEKMKKSLSKLHEYEKECLSLKATVDEITEQLTTVNIENEVKVGEITRLSKQLEELGKVYDEFEKLTKDKEKDYIQQAEQFTRLRKELEGKCEVYEGEMEILQTLVTEQKQQLIETFKEHEHEMNLKILDLQQRDEEITKLRNELNEIRESSRTAGAELSDNLEKECERLRESLRINKALNAEQINELANKQETIDTLKQQIEELNENIREWIAKFVEKDDEAADLRITIANYKQDYNSLQKDNDEQKIVVDKLLSELHSYKGSKEQIAQLELEVQKLNESKLELVNSNKDLEKRCKEQLEKMKKYAVNLKKRTAQCQEFESKIQALETKSGDNDLQQELNANIVLLNERIIDYEFKVKSQDEHLVEIQAALQTKTIEMLESIENNEKLENDLKFMKDELHQREQDIIQLKNALAAAEAATQQHHTSSTDDWDNSAFDESNIELNAEIEKLQSELMIAREQIMIKEQEIKELQEERQQFEENEKIRNHHQSQLETQFNENKTKLNEIEMKLQQSNQQSQKLTEELSVKSLKFEKSKAVIKERNNQIQRLQAQIKELQEKLSAQPEETEEQNEIVRKEVKKLMSSQPTMEVKEPPKVSKTDYDALQMAYDSLNSKYMNEKLTFEQTIARLETLHDGIQAKLQEDMSYIESLELENTRIKEKLCKLEECVGTFEERRSSMERKANLLDAQMQSRTDEYNKAEDELIYRLNMLSAHDEVIAQRLIDSQEEKDILQDRLDKLQSEFTDLTAQYNKLEKEYKNYKEQNDAELDAELQKLRKQLQTNEAELEHVRNSYDAKLAAKATEIDELENDLSEQLERINAEKRSIYEDLERSRDECTELKDELMRLNESLNAAEQSKQESERELSWLRMQNDSSEQDQYELQELRMQALQDKTELDNLRQQIETLANNHQSETDALRMQIADLDNLRMQVSQNQTDDQVFIETENKRLSELLSEKEAIIAEYQRQNLQLQMAAATNAAAAARNPQQPDLFASIGSENVATAQPSPINMNNNLLIEQELAEKNSMINRLQAEIKSLRERPLEGQNISMDSHTTASMSGFVSNDIIPAPPMFFASNQAVPTPFDEIVQRRIVDQPQFAAASSSAFSTSELDHPTIEDLQRNVSDLEKYNQELEHKLAARNNQIEEFRQHMNEAHMRQLNADQEIKRLGDQLQQANEQLQERTELQEQLECRMRQLEEQMKEQVDMITSDNIKSQKEFENSKEFEQRFQSLEALVEEKKKNIDELTHQLEGTLRLTSHLEAQIITSMTTDEEKKNITEDDQFKSNVAPSLDMFFGNTTAAESVAFEDIIKPPQIPEISNTPVIEAEIVPEKAYLCQPDAKENVPKDFNFDFGDDVWNATEDAHWGGSEVASDVKHFSENATTQSLLSHEQQLELDLETSNERIKELENILKESEIQKQKLQEKLTKSLKVVNKYKTQNEELKRSSTGSTQASFFDDLAATIQDELKQQVAKLEAELNEQHKQQREASAEKEKLLKRIDMLTAGNERMAEMKERQDMDMDMYKTRINELQQKLNKLEDWDGAMSVETPSSSVPKVEQIHTSGNDNVAKIQELESNLKILQAEVDDLNGDKQELQALLDEERANQNIQDYQQRLAELNNKYSKVCEEHEALKLTHDSLENQNRQLQSELDELKRNLVTARAEASRCNDLKQMYMDLENKLQNEEAKHMQETAKLQSECREMKEELEKLRTEWALAEKTKSVSLPISELSSNSPNFDELSVKIQEKDAEIDHLKQRVEDLMREDQTEKLVLEILTKNQEIHMLKMKVKDLEDDKQELEHNLTLQISKEIQQKQEQKINEETTDNDEALKRVQQLEMQMNELQDEKCQMEEELNVLNAHIMSSLEIEEKLKKAVLDLDTKNIEIKELRHTLDSLRNNAEKQGSSAQQDVDVTALNTRWEALVEQRCSEIAQMWRTHLEQRELEFRNVEASLKAEIETLQKTQRAVDLTSAHPTQQLPHSVSVDTSAASSTPVSTASATSPSVSADSSSADVSKDGTPLHIINEADADELITKMQTALENQELEIVSLKEQLAIRSAEYARLAAQYDPFKLQTGHSFEPTRSLTQRSNENADVVHKSELDLAMYMLHQRDMRIEEMTVELVALLEERDTLQLKLSNTLRQMEAIKTHINYVEPSTTEAVGTNSSGALTSTTSSDSPLKSITSKGSDDSANELHQKLSQLQTVNHSKDKLIQEEREHRSRQMERIRQIDRIQQDVARIPTAAVSQLIGTDISQSNQSPSSALLNWLWGNKQQGSDNGGSGLN